MWDCNGVYGEEVIGRSARRLSRGRMVGLIRQWRMSRGVRGINANICHQRRQWKESTRGSEIVIGNDGNVGVAGIGQSGFALHFA